MEKNKTKIRIGIIFSFFIVTFFLLNSGLQTLDDFVYKDAFCDIPSYFNWLKEFYSVWSGRITVTTLINIFTNMPTMVFNIVNTIVFGIVICTIYKIINVLFENIDETVKCILIFCIPCFIYCMNIAVISSGCLWISGALNYFWPMGFCLVSLYPFICELKGIELKKKKYIIFFLANIISAFAEQTAMVLICFGLITLVISRLEKRKLNKMLLLHFIIILLFSTILFIAPGNSVRSEAETLLWYYDYNMLSIGDKIFQGFNHFVSHMINGNFILFGYLVVHMFLLNIRKIKTEKLKFFLSFLILIYWCINVFFKRYDILDFGNVTLSNFYKTENFIKVLINIFVFSIIGIRLFDLFENKKIGMIISIIYFASMCSVIALGFSPTVFASGNRIFTLTDYLLVLVNGALMVEYIKKKNVIKNMIYLDILIAFAFVYYVYFFINVGENIIY